MSTVSIPKRVLTLERTKPLSFLFRFFREAPQALIVQTASGRGSAAKSLIASPTCRGEARRAKTEAKHCSSYAAGYHQRLCAHH